MVVALLSFLFCFIRVISVELIEYKFGINFGQIFHDYSSNNNYAVNGISSLTTTLDTIATDRGAFFQGNNIITLPPNDMSASGLILGNTFTILL